MKKVSIYVSIAVAFFVLIFYVIDIVEINDISTKTNFKFEIPQIKPITVFIPQKSSVGNFDVWNLKLSTREKAQNIIVTPGKNGKKNKTPVGFEYRKINGIPTLFNISNKKYRWEFFGVVKTHNGYKAVFFNPSLPKDKLKLVGRGFSIDSNLTLTDIGDDNATVEYKADNTTKRFVISIFDISLKRFNKKGVDNK